MKIYTKTGDRGETGLPGGRRVGKDHAVIEACGTLDELNSVIGVVRSYQLDSDVDQPLAEIQSDLLDVGARVAGCADNNPDFPRITSSRAADLEAAIDRFQEELPRLTSFILPAGSPEASHLHLARSICRRAERRLVGVMQESAEWELDRELAFLNRLSDFLFVTARLVNIRNGNPEVIWRCPR